ncbi:MAG: histidinol-phosphate transaminase [Motiliproteus sp.]
MAELTHTTDTIHTTQISFIDLSANENPLGPSPKALRAIEQSLSGLHRYPEKDGDPLRDALAQQHGLNREQLLLGNGATELLEFAARACLSHHADEPAEALIATPCFIPYQKVIQRAGGTLVSIPCALGVDPLDALLAAVTGRTRLIILGTPNNPTGSMIKQTSLERFVAALPKQVLLVLDEAYIEYIDHPECADSLRLLAQGHNLLLLRSLSKAYGLAGLRIGYALGTTALIDQLNGQRQHYNTNTLAQAAALAAIADQDHLSATLANNRLGRDYLGRSFRALGLNFLPSQANFFLLEVGDGDAWVQGLAQQGIRVKPMDRYRLPQHIRISIGLPHQNQALVAALQQLLHTRAEAQRNQPCSQLRIQQSTQ